jgi:hypothetical protein
MNSSCHTSTPPKHEDEVCSFNNDLTIFDSSSSNEDESSSDPKDYMGYTKDITKIEEITKD